MTTILIGVLGLVIVLIATRSLARTFRRGAFRVRGYRLIRRRNHPIMFWVNAGGIGILCAIGLALIGWALSEMQ